MSSNYYETSDLGLAAALLTYGSVLVRVNKENPKRAIFIFATSRELNDLVEAFRAGSLSVSALSYFENTKRLKSRIYGD